MKQYYVEGGRGDRWWRSTTKKTSRGICEISVARFKVHFSASLRLAAFSSPPPPPLPQPVGFRNEDKAGRICAVVLATREEASEKAAARRAVARASVRAQ